MKPLTDERGVLIEEFDVLRVFHFTAAKRREKIYMYKQVRKNNDGFLVGHHLNGEFKVSPPGDTWYYLSGDSGLNSGKMIETIVVQSNNWEKFH